MWLNLNILGISLEKLQYAKMTINLCDDVQFVYTFPIQFSRSTRIMNVRQSVSMSVMYLKLVIINGR